MEGLSKYPDRDFFEDTVIWYDKLGNITSKKNYKKNVIDGNTEMYFN